MIHPAPRTKAVRKAVIAFTLLEVLIAIAIFAGVIAAIYSTWTSILRSSQVAQTAAAEIQRSRVAVRTLEEALLGALIPVPRTPQGSRMNADYYSFLADGDPAEPFLSFVARLPESFPRGGRFPERPIRRVTFNLERGSAGDKELVLRQTPLLFEMDRDEQENPLVLAKNVLRFTLEFWDDRAAEWQIAWPATNQVPPLIRFSLATGREQRRGIDSTEVISRVIPMVGSGALIGLRSGTQTPGMDLPDPSTGLPQNPVIPP